MNKRGDNQITENIIFLVLNTVFLVLLIVFIARSTDAVSVYEQAYAKQIALMVDKASSNSTVSLFMDKGVNLAKKNNIHLKDVVIIKDNTIIVSLAKGGGYGYKYFTDENVTIQKNLEYGNTLILKISRSTHE